MSFNDKLDNWASRLARWWSEGGRIKKDFTSQPSPINYVFVSGEDWKNTPSEEERRYMVTKINLGDLVVDNVSGFEGIAVCKHDYLNGCTRFSVQPRVDKEGKLPDIQTFDEPSLAKKVEKVVEEGPKNTGGPEKYMPTARTTGGR